MSGGFVGVVFFSMNRFLDRILLLDDRLDTVEEWMVMHEAENQED